MTLPSNDAPMDMMRQLEALRAELAEVRRQQTERTTTHRWPARIGMLAGPLLVMASWAWSAENQTTTSPDIERRVTVLESLVRRGSAGTTQMTAPFEVIGPDGKIILRVGNDPVEAAVSIWSEPGVGGRTRIRSHNGMSMGGLGTKSQGDGVVGQAFVADSEGNVRAWMTGLDGGAILVARKGDFKDVAGMTNGEGGTPQVIVQKGNSSVTITESNEGGYISMSNSKGKPGTFLRTGSISVFNKEGSEAAEMTADDGWGRVQVLNKGGKVVAKMDSERTIGTGTFYVMNPAGKPMAGLLATETGALISVGNEAGDAIITMSSLEGPGKLNVMNSVGKTLVQMTGGGKAGGGVAVANAEGMPLAEMAISEDGRGLFQVNKNQRAIAVLTQAVDRPGGVVQISNFSGATVSSLTVNDTGGYLQLANNSGLPSVEATTLPDGRGTVRAGPLYKCVSVRTPLFSGGILDCIVGSTK
ncbi:MAG: hypothetical protein KIS97_05040 [Nitrospira sp.]|nr:hypothetical protein [Nitrospira sp.]